MAGTNPPWYTGDPVFDYFMFEEEEEILQMSRDFIKVAMLSYLAITLNTSDDSDESDDSRSMRDCDLSSLTDSFLSNDSWCHSPPYAMSYETFQGSSSYTAKLLVAPNSSILKRVLSVSIVQSCQAAFQTRHSFTIALSGGSVPSLLQQLPREFQRIGIDPQWDKWHVILADERCVASSNADSNLRAIREHFTSKVPIPFSQVYGIDESLLSESSDAVATAYEEQVLRIVLQKGMGMLDCVVLGFGPDGHTCSLFPHHSLVEEQSRLVSYIDDSPKPPASRITLTFPVLNNLSRRVILCGAGYSKASIVRSVFETTTQVTDDPIQHVVKQAKAFEATMRHPALYPCAMVRPKNGGNTLMWVVDEDAASGGKME